MVRFTAIRNAIQRTDEYPYSARLRNIRRFVPETAPLRVSRPVEQPVTLVPQEPGYVIEDVEYLEGGFVRIWVKSRKTGELIALVFHVSQFPPGFKPEAGGEVKLPRIEGVDHGSLLGQDEAGPSTFLYPPEAILLADRIREAGTVIAEAISEGLSGSDTLAAQRRGRAARREWDACAQSIIGQVFAVSVIFDIEDRLRADAGAERKTPMTPYETRAVELFLGCADRLRQKETTERAVAAGVGVGLPLVFTLLTALA